MNLNEISLYEKKVISNFNYLKNLRDYSKLIDHKETFEIYEHLFKCSFDTNRLNEIINLSFDSEFPRVLIIILNNLKRKICESTPRIILDLLYFSLSITSNFLANTKFSQEFQKLNGLEVLFDLLRNIPIVSRLHNLPFANLIINSLSQMAKNPERLKWRQEKAVEVILNYCGIAEPDTKLSCLITLAYIAQENEISEPYLSKIGIGIAQVISKLVENLEENKDTDRNDSMQDVLKIKISDSTWDICELLEALYHLIVNDSIKENVFNKDTLEKIILYGNQIEKAHAVKVLWQFCFDKNISEDFLNNKLLYNLTEEYANNQQIIQELREYSKGCLTTCRRNTIEKYYFTKHIMISYSLENLDFVKRLKQDLEKDGHKVWLDINAPNGCCFDSISKAIEDSKCVLICMSEKYKVNPYCRLEAEYAAKLNKPIVPVMFVKDYIPNGWLNKIVQSKNIINIVNYEQDVNTLKEEIKTILDFISNMNKRPDRLNEWTEEIVTKWFYEKNFNENICKYVLPSDGQVLSKIYQVLKIKPEIFYQSINPLGLIKTNDLDYFVNELGKLKI